MRYYDDAVNAANKGLEYWTNIDLHVNELLNNHLLTKIQQATPLSKDKLNAVIRPETVSALQERIDSYV